MPAARDPKTPPAGWRFPSAAAARTTGRRLPASPTAITQPADVDRDHPAWFFYTSGTTGRPKAGVLTHGQMDYVVCNHLCDLMPATTEQDASLVVAPLSHGAGIHALPQIARGAATILLSGERLDCEEAWRLVEPHRVTNMFTVPTILTMLTRHESVDRYDHSVLALRHLCRRADVSRRPGSCPAQAGQGAGAVFRHGRGDRQYHRPAACACTARTMPRCRWEAAVFRAPAWMSRSWTIPASRSRPASPARSACAARGCSPAITTTPRRPRKPPPMAGSIPATSATWMRAASSISPGRASDMYISGGSNVYPREIEEALLLHPAVAEACVVGMPHEKWGESGAAVLVLEPGPSASAAELLSHLDGRLAKYKWPQAVCLLARTAEIGLRQGHQARRETSAAEGRVMANPPIDPAAITDYHMHVYYDPESRERAGQLRQWVEERFTVRMGRWHDVRSGHMCGDVSDPVHA